MKRAFSDRANKAIKNAPEISSSLIRKVFGRGKDLAVQRESICAECEHEVDDTALGGKMCDLCLCNIGVKIYSNEGCPLDKW